MAARAVIFLLLIAPIASDGAPFIGKHRISAALDSPVSALFKWVAKSPPKNPQTEASLVRFESGYLVETISDGNRLGLNPHAIRVSPDGELIAVDSVNSNIVRITPPLSAYSRGRLVAGSFQGRSGLVDGKPSDARFNHPRGVAVDRRGNIYVADVSNLAIRKIGHSGVSTIAGGKASAAGFRDGPSEEARFSADFDVVYVKSLCSLLVVDRGNAALRKIFLHDDDCTQDFSSVGFSEILLLLGAVMAGYISCMIRHGIGNKKSGSIEQLKPKGEEPGVVSRSLRRLLSALRGVWSTKSKAKQAATFLKPKNSAAAELKQQKSAKAAMVRDYLANSAKLRRRQEFDEFYGAAIASRAKSRPGQRGE